MFHVFVGAKAAYFVAGAAAGVLGTQAVKSKTLRNLTVAGLTKGYQVKDAVSETLCNLREDASDLCAEAKEKAREDQTDLDDILGDDQEDESDSQ